MASNELLRQRDFARVYPAHRRSIETAARLCAQTQENIRSCRETVRQARELLDILRAKRAKAASN